MTYRRQRYGFDDEDDKGFFEWRRDHPVKIGHDVWIGHGALMMPGVTIGNGAVIGAGAVVTHDIDPFIVVAGVPAEEIGRRFPPNVAARLEATSWWNWSRETIAERFEMLCGDVETFLDAYGQNQRPTPRAKTRRLEIPDQFDSCALQSGFCSL